MTVLPVAMHKRGELPVKIRIIFGAHVPAAAPGFVPYAPETYFPGIFTAICSTQIRHGAFTGKVGVLHPVCQLLGGTAAHVARQVWLHSQLFAHIEEIVRAEAVVLRNISPPGIYDGRAFLFRPYAVFPVISVRKAAAGPAEIGYFHFTQRFDHVFTDAIRIRDMRSISHVEATVDTMSQMLRKVTVNITVNRLRWLASTESNRILRLYCLYGKQESPNCRPDIIITLFHNEVLRCLPSNPDSLRPFKRTK